MISLNLLTNLVSYASFIAHLFSDANWRKSHASLLRTLADAPGVGEVSIAPCALPSAAETQMLFEK